MRTGCNASLLRRAPGCSWAIRARTWKPTQYLGLRSGAASATTFAWLVRQGTAPLPAVAALADEYGDRVEVEYGELPDWLVASACLSERPVSVSVGPSTGDLRGTEAWRRGADPSRAGRPRLPRQRSSTHRCSPGAIRRLADSYAFSQLAVELKFEEHGGRHELKAAIRHEHAEADGAQASVTLEPSDLRLYSRHSTSLRGLR
jgi:hypothetical protein